MLELWFSKTENDQEIWKDEPSNLKLIFPKWYDVQLTRKFLRTPYATTGYYWITDTEPVAEFQVSEGGSIAFYNDTYDVWVTTSDTVSGHWSDVNISFDND